MTPTTQPFSKQPLRERRDLGHEPQQTQTSLFQPAHDLATILHNVGHEVDSRLRELSPQFRLKPTGYRLPIPRVRRINYGGLDETSDSEPVEIRDALIEKQFLLLNLPRTYPDNSLPWVIADTLLTEEISHKQALPIVIDGSTIRPPNSGFTDFASHPIRSLAANTDAQLIVIVENVPLDSKTRLGFLIEQVRTLPDAKFIFVTRGEVNLLLESEIVTALSAHVFELRDISFLEIAHFLRKNFDISESEAEVIALRLRNIFDQFKLSAHPTYFAGIPSETLSALLQANRRAELIQLAVDGFLTFVVASDPADVSLSRTTRSRFLRMLTVELKVEKHAYDHERLIAFTRVCTHSRH